ncbi:hypothetical protein GTW51_09050 [Aurantimonas aggregata]|uniref:Uncharacterized protein n=1 Tax=Aurantimonas aggregata TaxID=2047720 RepID=A0A6L9MG84_9HYPH|nr:hypothetical protein [Aurantimonas aggregata]NDV86849.1 hypothetical protein [Aurantimonas aggregata]
MKTILAAVLATIVATSAGAGELKPLAGTGIAVGGVIGAAYYTVEPDGFRVVATIAHGESGEPIRVVSTLADGQSVTIAVPASLGEHTNDVVIARTGDRVEVTHRPVPDLRADVSFD